MTKTDAILELRNGKKLTHRHFSPDEFIEMKNGVIHDENGYKLTPYTDNRGQRIDFWTDRTGGDWETDWELYEK